MANFDDEIRSIEKDEKKLKNEIGKRDNLEKRNEPTTFVKKI